MGNLSYARQCRNRLFLIILGVAFVATSAWAQNNSEKSFHAVISDAHAMETDVKNVRFYWEDKVSETAFVPHELKHIPVKRGTATVNVRFETIKQIDVKPGTGQVAGHRYHARHWQGRGVSTGPGEL